MSRQQDPIAAGSGRGRRLGKARWRDGRRTQVAGGIAGPERTGHAVVVGASIAGLLAARALSTAFDRVTVIERDELPPVGEGRKAIPQGRHVHVLLASGRQAMEEALPGIGAEIVGDGWLRCPVTQARVVVGGHRLTRDVPGPDLLLASRPLIEGHIRRRVLELPNVALLERCEVRGLVAGHGRDRVSGVRLHGVNGGEHAIEADLVVCATGRAAQLPAWLGGLGHPVPRIDTLKVELTYATRHLRLRPGALAGERFVLVGPRRDRPRGFGLVEQEHGQWVLTVFGYGEDDPPIDVKGHLDFLASVAPPEIVADVREAEPRSDVIIHRFPANQRRRYERLSRFPDGLLVIGDAIASFNPLYGQGMSVAALEARELERCLARGRGSLARRFFQAAGRIIDPAWDLAIGGDLDIPSVPGRRSLALRISNAYVARLLRAAEHDPVVAGAFGEVSDLLAPPSRVMRPEIIWRVLRETLGHAAHRPEVSDL